MKNAVTRKPLTAGARVFLALAVILGLVNLIDFVFYGHRTPDLLVAIGFALMAYGTYWNWNRSRPDSDGDPTFYKAAQYATAIGVILILASMIARYWP